MKVFHKISSIRQYVQDCSFKRLQIGLVPTMGSLHEGHVELVRNAKRNNDITIASIFVNPTQFNKKEDLEKYPRNLEKDLKVLESLGSDAVFCPSVDEIYSVNRSLELNVGHFEEIMEGKYRPGHFAGVALIVTKLFNITKPNRAYFGQKDLQQLALVQKLVDEFNFDLEVIGVPTVREVSGLALSSRNRRLDENQRAQAAIIYKGLKILKSNILDGLGIKQSIQETKEFYNSSDVFEVEYLEVVDLNNLEPIVNDNQSYDLALCVAGYVGGVRLLDNICIFKN